MNNFQQTNNNIYNNNNKNNCGINNNFKVPRFTSPTNFNNKNFTAKTNKNINNIIATNKIPTNATTIVKTPATTTTNSNNNNSIGSTGSSGVCCTSDVSIEDYNKFNWLSNQVSSTHQNRVTSNNYVSSNQTTSNGKDTKQNVEQLYYNICCHGNDMMKVEDGVSKLLGGGEMDDNGGKNYYDEVCEDVCDRRINGWRNQRKNKGTKKKTSDKLKNETVKIDGMMDESKGEKMNEEFVARIIRHLYHVSMMHYVSRCGWIGG